jgi:hypothetical protein
LQLGERVINFRAYKICAESIVADRGPSHLHTARADGDVGEQREVGLL